MPEKSSIEQKQKTTAVADPKAQPTIAEQIAQKEYEIAKVKQIMAKQRELAQQSVANASDVLEREAGRFAGRLKADCDLWARNLLMSCLRGIGWMI